MVKLHSAKDKPYKKQTMGTTTTNSNTTTTDIDTTDSNSNEVLTRLMKSNLSVPPFPHLK
jgi:hypothetical protein